MQIDRATPEDIPEIQALWREYWEWLGFADEFQEFARECAGLPGVYAEPHGRLLLAKVGGQAAGTAALRPITVRGERSCEAKRVYVRPAFRGLGLVLSLMARLIEEARHQGYAAMYADTLPSMSVAQQMYKQLGFVEVAPYGELPTPGAIHLRLIL